MDVLNDPKYSYLIKKQPFYYKIFKTFFYYYSKFVFTFYTPVTISGKKNIPNCSFIFSSNHNSHLDVALLSVSSQKDYNHFAMLAAKDYFFDSWLRRTSINMVMNLIPIDRKVDGVRNFSIEDTLKLCKAFMDFDQRNLIMFPEGTRTERGSKGRYKTGATRLAVLTGASVIPVAVTSGRCWPRRSFWLRPGVIDVSFGRPISSKDRDPDELMAEIKDWIELEMNRLDPEAYTEKRV